MGPMMKDTLTALWSSMNNSWCARRKEPPVTMKAKQQQGPATVKPPSTAIKKPDLATKGPTYLPVTLKLKPASDLEKKAEKNNTKKPTSPGLVDKQLSPAAEVFVPLKAVSDSDKSTTAGSGDNTEDDRLYESNSDFEVAASRLDTWPPAAAPPPGLVAPPGLEHPGLDAPPGLAHPLSVSKAEPSQGKQFNPEAAPFVPAFSQKATTPNAKTISISNELTRSVDMPATLGHATLQQAALQYQQGADPGKFVGATLHLQQSLAQLKGALVEYETCMANEDVTSLHPAARANTEVYTAEVANKISHILTAQTAGNQMHASTQQLWNPQVMSSTAVMPNTTWYGMGVPAQHAQAAGFEQQSWQQHGHGFRNGPKPGRQQLKAPPAPSMSSMSADENPAETLRTNLQELDKMPADRVLIVRRIYRLGLESPTILKNYFDMFGVVEKVLVSHSRNKSRRVRPAGLGFVLMSSAEDTATILNLGSEQLIDGALITVHAYETRAREIASQEEEDQNAPLEK